MFAFRSEWRFGRHQLLPVLKVIGKVPTTPGINVESYMLEIAVRIIDLAIKTDGFVFQPSDTNEEDIWEEAESGKYILTFLIEFKSYKQRDNFFKKISEELFPY